MTQSLDSFAGLLRSAERSAVHLKTRDVYAIAAEDERFYEHALSFTDVAAGEEVRRLPRREESELVLPGDDFWLSLRAPGPVRRRRRRRPLGGHPVAQRVESPHSGYHAEETPDPATHRSSGR
ncbi:DUF6879 family protein [Streptomyces sp. NPDC005573]|uniref:DUF6879 family protein n=1 Tax=Streptomyces sp. NPDC005573 TaxID=3156890 RepID=UPI0033A807E8